MTLSFIFIFADGLIFANVATNFASWFAPKSDPTLLICNEELPPLNVNLSLVSNSVVPSALINEYLSSSNGRKVSLLPELTAAVKVSVVAFITTSKVFLIVKVVFDKSTLDTNLLGIGVNNVLSSELSNGDVTSVRSGTSTDVLTDPKGRNPSATPETVVIPVTRTSFAFTSVILAKVFKFFPSPPNFNKLPTFNLPGNWGFPLVIVLTPDPPVSVDDVTFADPNTNKSFWITSAEKVFAKPILPKSGPP